MHKSTWTTLSLFAVALPAFAAPMMNNKVANPQATATRTPVAKTNTAKTTTKPATNANTAAPPKLPTITPDGSAAIAAVKTTLVPDISPAARGYQVVINVPQQRLFLYNNGALEKVYPVAVGKAITQTTLGEHKIGGKAYNPTWHIPKSIQAESKNGLTSVPPGPNNPLGPVFVRLGDPKLGLGIHGTNAPSSVPGVRSHGCVRMKSEQALDFANTITTGSPALVSYEMAALNVDAKNQLWLAAYKDPYSKNTLNTNALKQSIKTWSAENKVTISDATINQVLRVKSGLPVCISCKGKGRFTIQGHLQSLAWNSGSSALTTPKGMKNAVVPSIPEEVIENNVVEVDAGDDVPAKPSKAAPKSKTAPKANATNVNTVAPTLTAPVSTPKTSKSSKAAPKVPVKATSVFSDDAASETANERPLYPTQNTERVLEPVNRSKK